MTVLGPVAEASPPVEDEIRQLSELYSKLADLDINHLRAFYNHKAKLNIVAAEKKNYYKGINQFRENLNGIFSDWNKLLSPVKVSQGGIEVILGTEADHQNIDSAWEEYMKTQINGSTIRDTDATVEQRKVWKYHFQSLYASIESKLKRLSCTTCDYSALVMATSLRFFNLSTRRNDFGSYTTIPDRGSTNVDAIDRGSAAVHSGNVRIRAFLIQTDSSDQFKNYSELFKTIYGVTPLEVAQGAEDKYSFDSKNTEIANLRGSMAHCLSFSKLTHDLIKDSWFERLREQCETVYQRYLKELGSAANAQKQFDNDAIVGRTLIQMRSISKHITWLERQRRQAHFLEDDSGSSTAS
ncbi:predicted protein [Sclerotinia sclerotiorum 1980 UF-70]|uniref:Uncharacterized protein n=2 Tax=Sclerotinia sclerotiorum (strain ATCC 18683 / 1980 / Ss-1) TaxID=665079 RepID=A0A1D9Q6I4_SCLS1|nr:predicted protein [Sclerotinia sclerotiorum 1980 UF-70]APA10564.1 hypothetical protein sscle_06g053340 [Sclerotinia sclerotiorum 1980 UF-70]EDN97782.1 predicted protein [Sclerotinia sclerotiorum 1980 UF-70]